MVDVAREEAMIRRQATIALLITAATFGMAFFSLPLIYSFPESISERLGYAAQLNAFILVWVLIGVGLVSRARRQSPRDIGGSAYAPPSPTLAPKVAFLQNTLEQAVLTGGALFAFAATAQGAWLSLGPATVVLFGTGRVLFYRGYPIGAGGRALGMSLTLSPGLLLLLYAMGMSFPL